MPHAALKPCSYPGCTNLVARGRCSQHPYPDAHDPDSQKLYNTWQWKRISKAQLIKDPWCADCLKGGIYTRATECDHVIPHRGDKVKFYTGSLQSLCKIDHDRKTAQEVLNK